MNKASLFCILILSLGAGILYYAYMQHWIVLQMPHTTTPCTIASQKMTSKKNVTVYYWYHAQMKSEATMLITSDDQSSNLRHVVMSWLTLLEDVGHKIKKIGVESVMMNGSGSEAYLSFTHSLLDKDSSIYDSWMRIESLLKTIKLSDKRIQRVHFLVHHKPMIDTHLDFSQPWPVNGWQYASS